MEALYSLCNPSIAHCMYVLSRCDGCLEVELLLVTANIVNWPPQACEILNFISAKICIFGGFVLS